MDILVALAYGGLFAAIAYFIFTINYIAEASSKPTRSTLKASFMLLVVLPIIFGIFYGFSESDTIFFKLGSLISSAAGMYFIARGIRDAIIEAYGRDAEAEVEEDAEREKLEEENDESDLDEDWIKNGEWKAGSEGVSVSDK